MNKIWLIIQREFFHRVRKRSFIVITLIGPLLFGALITAPAMLSNIQLEKRTILVHDRATVLDFHPGNEDIAFTYIDPSRYNLQQAKQLLKEKPEFYALLYIPTGETWDPDFISAGISMYSQGDISLKVQSYIESLLKSKIQEEKLKLLGVDPAVVKQSETNVRLRTFYLEDTDRAEKQSATELKFVLAYIGSLLIYLFIFLYGSMVMRGIIEEKANRIVEIIITSVKPFQLMMGKIIGIALTGLLQFAIWVLLSTAVYALASQIFFREKFEAARELALQQEQLRAEGSAIPMDIDRSLEIINAIQTIDFPLILSLFLFYFIFGYLAYGALFAIVGSMVDNETDSQQLVLPISIPLIVAIIAMTAILDNPDSALAKVLSFIPLTSPVVMMTRIPFGVPWWETIVSMLLLILFFVLATWIAGRIYQVGILMYGKRYTLSDLVRWFTNRG
ncbi:ABC transporter permease [Thermaurantimonas aggregans]|uniref:ABC transporter permease n=1 Tax=Thermaurantimonas aggregans TaxID=2173829 RepID=A0A401XJC2_9FLAO|nr:ABC transporter permease [Thermaurantimonas aggregans]MCX8148673.1 ABC transporter permease [Thermaurantimonas aggregans]GCD77137.1 ABC transporter permease [Thermaurantimonas aggregans]